MGMKKCMVSKVMISMNDRFLLLRKKLRTHFTVILVLQNRSINNMQNTF